MLGHPDLGSRLLLYGVHEDCDLMSAHNCGCRSGLCRAMAVSSFRPCVDRLETVSWFLVLHSDLIGVHCAWLLPLTCGLAEP
jgi:hypothetical protein